MIYNVIGYISYNHFGYNNHCYNLHCALAAAQCIVIDHVCLFVCVFVCWSVIGYGNLKFRASILTKLGL